MTRDELFSLPLNTITESTAHNRPAVTKCLKLHNYRASSNPLYADSAPTSLNKQLQQESEASQWSQSYSVPGEQLFFAPEAPLCSIIYRAWPSQLFTLNITVALAAPLRSYLHYTRHCTNTGGSGTVSYQKNPRGRNCNTVTFFISSLFI